MRFERVLVLTILMVLPFVGCDDGTTVEPEPEGPPPPDWVHVAATAADAITVRWTPVAGQSSRYVLSRSLSADAGYATLDTLETEVIEYRDASVTAGERYYYRLRALDTIGRLGSAAPTSWGDAVDNATPASPEAIYPPDAATDLELNGTLQLAWSAQDADGPRPAATVYFGAARSALETVAVGSADTTASLERTLALTRTYFWRVILSDEHGATAISPVWSFSTRLERVSIPAGPFHQGDCGTFHAADSSLFCKPENPVQVEAFNIDKFEVSNQLFAQFLNEQLAGNYIRVSQGTVLRNPGSLLYARLFPDGDDNAGIEYLRTGAEHGVFQPRAGMENHPAVEVTWHGAQYYAETVGRRLPSEAEWEKAARGTSPELGLFYFDNVGQPDSIGLGYPYPWGTQAAARYFNHDASGDPFESLVGTRTTPVGFYDGATHSGYSTGSNASSYGVFDLAGNVAEWCADDFAPYAGGTYGGMKVVKGGGWRSAPIWCQTYWRQEMKPDSTDGIVGFRTAISE